MRMMLLSLMFSASSFAQTEPATRSERRHICKQLVTHNWILRADHGRCLNEFQIESRQRRDGLRLLVAKVPKDPIEGQGDPDIALECRLRHRRQVSQQTYSEVQCDR